MLERLAPSAEEAQEIEAQEIADQWIGAFSQCRIYSRYIALQIDAIEAGRLPK